MLTSFGPKILWDYYHWLYRASALALKSLFTCFHAIFSPQRSKLLAFLMKGLKNLVLFGRPVSSGNQYTHSKAGSCMIWGKLFSYILVFKMKNKETRFLSLSLSKKETRLLSKIIKKQGVPSIATWVFNFFENGMSIQDTRTKIGAVIRPIPHSVEETKTHFSAITLAQNYPTIFWIRDKSVA